MKIVIVIDYLADDLAGTEGQVIKLVQGLSTRNVVELVVLKRTAWITAHQNKLPCQVTIIDLGGVKSLRFPLGVLQLTMRLLRIRADVVHTYFPISNIIGVLCAKAAGVPVIFSSRRDYGHWITPAYLRVTKFANRFLSGVITNSPEVGRFTVKEEGVSSGAVSVIYNGVDISALQRKGAGDGTRERLGIPPCWKVITLVANYRPIKRHDTLLDAFALLSKNRPDVCLLFVGAEVSGEPARDSVIAHALKHGLSDRLFMDQAVGNIQDFLAITSIGVNSSESEGMSNAVIEYMAAGVPVVVSNGGGNPDLVQHEVDGLVFPVGDSVALSVCLERLLDDQGLRERCVRNATMKVREMALPNMVARHEETYRAALART